MSIRTGDKSLPPKLEPSDALPPLVRSDSDSEPPTLKPVDAPLSRETQSKRLKFDGEIPELVSPAPRLNGHVLQSAVLDGDAGSAPAGRAAALLRKSKTGGDDEESDRVDGKPGGEGGEEDEDGAQLGSESILSVVIPRLETLLHKKRKHGDGREEERGEAELEEEGESPVKRLNTGTHTSCTSPSSSAFRSQSSAF